MENAILKTVKHDISTPDLVNSPIYAIAGWLQGILLQ